MKEFKEAFLNDLHEGISEHIMLKMMNNSWYGLPPEFLRKEVIKILLKQESL